MKSTFDDAVFFESLSDSRVLQVLAENGIDPQSPYFIANYHYWGQDEEMKVKSSQRFAELTTKFIERSG